MRISLFLTCLNDTLDGSTGQAVVKVLERLGHEVTFHGSQTCCGQMHLNSGYPREATRLARRFVRVFGDDEVIVCPSASCVGMVSEWYPRLLGAAAGAVPGRVFEFTELLHDRLGLETAGGHLQRSVYYHPTCHSLRGLRVADAPLRLLQAVEGLGLVTAQGCEECCGFGGTFAVKNAAVSGAMMGDTLDRVERSGAEVLTAIDNSCLTHLRGGLERRGSAIDVMHVAEILAT